jgi:hypothetical protein
MLTETSIERKLQPQMKKKGTALLAGYLPYHGSYDASLIVTYSSTILTGLINNRFWLVRSVFVTSRRGESVE